MRLAGWLSFPLLLLMGAQSTFAEGQNISGRVLDPRGNAVPDALVSLVAEDGERVQQTITGSGGQFTFAGISPGKYTLKLKVAGFEPVNQTLVVTDGEPVTADVRLKLATANEEVKVSTDVLDVNVMTPDPAERLLIRQETLDANPGRPGAPVSLPGLPIETASGGIKAPQYFAPGVVRESAR